MYVQVGRGSGGERFTLSGLRTLTGGGLFDERFTLSGLKMLTDRGSFNGHAFGFNLHKVQIHAAWAEMQTSGISKQLKEF